MTIESPFGQCAGDSCNDLHKYSAEIEQSAPGTATNELLKTIGVCEEGKGCVFTRGAKVALNDTVYVEGDQHA